MNPNEQWFNPTPQMLNLGGTPSYPPAQPPGFPGAGLPPAGQQPQVNPMLYLSLIQKILGGQQQTPMPAPRLQMAQQVQKTPSLGELLFQRGG